MLAYLCMPGCDSIPEWMIVCRRQVRAEYRLSAANQSVRFALEDLQVDNQLLTSGQPVVLARTRGEDL